MDIKPPKIFFQTKNKRILSPSLQMLKFSPHYTQQRYICLFFVFYNMLEFIQPSSIWKKILLLPIPCSPFSVFLSRLWQFVSAGMLLDFFFYSFLGLKANLEWNEGYSYMFIFYLSNYTQTQTSKAGQSCGEISTPQLKC